ncbi:MAG: ABC transporter ATP-binding protein [Halobacteria archaeon]
MAGPAIEVSELTKTYDKGRFRKRKEIAALDRVSFSVESGRMVGLLGPNGAGKTTLIKILCTLVLPTSGTARVMGRDVVADPAGARRSLGWVHGEAGGRSLYWRLTARDNLRFFAALHEVDRAAARKRVEALLEAFDLAGVADQRVLKFSTGMKAKLMVARALLHNPDVLLMDEPTAGLDVRMAQETRDLLRRLAAEHGKAILFTSHNLAEVEALCPRVVILHKGRLLADGPVEELAKRLRARERVEIRLAAAVEPGVARALESAGGVRGVMANGSTVEVEVERAVESIPSIVELLKARGAPVLSVGRKEPDLEEVFLSLTR